MSEGHENKLSHLSVDMLQSQTTMTLEPKTGLFTRDSRDPLILAARAFELGYLYV